MSPPFSDPDIEAAFARHAPPLRAALMHLRDLIFAVAERTPNTGHLVETLKWGQPAYLTEKPKSGTTIRIDADNAYGSDYALYVPCSTCLVETWRSTTPNSPMVAHAAFISSWARQWPKRKSAIALRWR